MSRRKKEEGRRKKEERRRKKEESKKTEADAPGSVSSFFFLPFSLFLHYDP
jgi:hypothetical protein